MKIKKKEEKKDIRSIVLNKKALNNQNKNKKNYYATTCDVWGQVGYSKGIC